MSNNDELEVEMRNYDNTLYAKSKIASDFSESVQKPVDSSRGYALRLTSEDGRTMWVGLKFHDRNEAFDFHEAFIIQKNNRQKEQQAKMNMNQQVDMSGFKLQPGQKIQIGGVGNTNNGFNGGGLFDNPFGASNNGNSNSGGNNDFG